MKKLSKLASLTLISLLGVSLAACNKANQTPTPDQTQQASTSQSTATQQAEIYQEVKLAGKTMGTTYHVSFSAQELSGYTAEQVQTKLNEFLVQFNKEVSTYDKTSEISRFNASTEVNMPFAISADFAKVVAKAIELHQLTNGYEDITVYPIVKALGFGPGKAVENLSEADFQRLKDQLGIDKFTLTQDDQGQYFLTKLDPLVQIDLSSIAKGYGVDKLGEIIASLGGKNYIAEIGGEVVAKGVSSYNDPWNVAIEQPTEDGSIKIQNVVALRNQAIATSGNYRNFRYEAGKRITHEIDPFTGRPITHNTASLTVVADNCMLADGLATGLYVMGSEKALELANKHNIAIFLIDFENGQFVTKTSKAFDEQVQLLLKK